MSLRRKVILYVGLTVAAVVLSLFLFSRFYLLHNYTHLEEREIVQNLERVKAALNNRLVEIDRMTSDYATWDDTYQFIKDSNPRYIETNLTVDTFQNLKMTFMFYVNSSGRVILSRYFDAAAGRFIGFPSDLAARLTANSALIALPSLESSVNGLLINPRDTFLIASRPIITSLSQGPIRGTLIFGRLLDQELQNTLSKTVGLPLAILPVGDRALPALSPGKPDLVRPLNSQNAAGYILLNDLAGQPGLIAKIEVPRHLYQQGERSLLVFSSLIFLFGGFMLALIIYFMDHTILSRLAVLNHTVEKIGLTGDLSTKVAVPGKDELSSLANEINKMLSALLKAQQQRSEMENRFEKLFEAIPEAIYLESLDGAVVDCNTAAQNMTGYTKEELLRLRTSDLVPEEQAKLFPSLIESVLNTGQFFIEGMNRRKNGEVFPVEAGATLIEVKGVKHLLVVIRDITERKALENKLAERVATLEDFYNLAVGRELKMAELEKEINSLLRQTGQPEKYQL